jgi:type II secretion system protein H
MTRSPEDRFSTKGFTLLELMIVLVLLVMLMAIAWPSLRKPLQRSSTQQAARQLYEDLAAARLSAIETGTTMSLRYEPGGYRYWIGPAEMARDDEATSSSDVELSTASSDSDEREDSFRRLRQVEGELADGVVFADPAAIDNEIPVDSTLSDMLADEMAETEEVEPLIQDELGEVVWSAPIFIYPTGRAENAELRLLDPQGYSLTVSVRGLTGAVTIGPLTYDRDKLEQAGSAFDEDPSQNAPAGSGTGDAFDASNARGVFE